MKRELASRLNALRQSGEITTGRRLAETMREKDQIDLFPGEGREVETAFGRCYFRELKFPLHYRHGHSALSGAFSCRGPELALPARDQSLHGFDPRQAVFLDIETTGLSGGAGTWAFLIGLGRVENDFFLLHQYFLRRPAEERALLSHFSQTAARYPAMVSFNGKMFDLPLIQGRQTLSGFKHTNPTLHLDLLQCARSLWKKRLASRTLRSLEEALLGIRRYDDIPGAEIPEVYFEFLRQGKTGRLKKVFAHNVTDILSMLTLLEKVALTANGQGATHPAEALALGGLCLQAGRVAEGEAYLRAAAQSGRGPLCEEAALKLAFYYKKGKKWGEAVALWEEAVANNTTNPTAYVELAKYYEHRCGDYHRARELTLAALLRSAPGRYANSGDQLSRAALEHRLRRINRRMGQEDGSKEHHRY